MNQPSGNDNQNDLESLFSKIFRNHECCEGVHTIDNMEAWLYRLTENKTIDFLGKLAANNRLKEAIWNNPQQIMSEAEARVSNCRNGTNIPTVTDVTSKLCWDQ